MTNLQYLDLSECQLGDSHFEAILQSPCLVGLEFLLLKKNNIGKVPQQPNAELVKKLRLIDLRDTKMTLGRSISSKYSKVVILATSEKRKGQVPQSLNQVWRYNKDKEIVGSSPLHLFYASDE